jgi:hypothetical protein
MTKRIMSYSRVIDTQGSDQTLFSGGQQGVLFTAFEQSGLSVKINPSTGGVITTSGLLTGSGLSFGDNLVVNGAGHIILSMWGELSQYYRLVNTNQLEVIVGSPIVVAKTGLIGSVSTTTGLVSWVPAGIYTDHTYSINSSLEVSWS